MQPLPELHWQLIRLLVFIQRDRLANIVHDDLARITASQVLLKIVADRRINRAVHVFIEHYQHFFAFHIEWFPVIEPRGGKKLQDSCVRHCQRDARHGHEGHNVLRLLGIERPA